MDRPDSDVKDGHEDADAGQLDAAVCRMATAAAAAVDLTVIG